MKRNHSDMQKTVYQKIFMSFVLNVFFTPTSEVDLLGKWCSALAQHGLECEFSPHFTLETWQDGFLPVCLKIMRSDAFPQAHRYGKSLILTGFELSILKLTRKTVPHGLARDLTKRLVTGFQTTFCTASGRSVADLRLQCLAAATLANIFDGFYHDPQQGKIFQGAQALREAHQEAESFENSPLPEASWILRPFPGWEAILPNADTKPVFHQNYST